MSGHEQLSLRLKRVMFRYIEEEVGNRLETDGPIKPIVTTTLHIPSDEPKTVAVTSMNRRIDKADRAQIKEDLGPLVSNKAMKSAKINPPPEIFDPFQRLGLKPGIIGPFVNISPVEPAPLDSWYYLREEDKAKTPVEVALSFCDSLILRGEDFNKLLAAYQQKFLGGVACRTIAAG
jgi:hypothetical protein